MSPQTTQLGASLGGSEQRKESIQDSTKTAPPRSQHSDVSESSVKAESSVAQREITVRGLRVVIVHDWLVGGGAERVVYELHKLYPDAPIYTSFCTDEWREKLNNKVITGFLQRWPFSKLRKFLPLLRIWWFSHLDLSSFDLVISSSGNGEAKFVKVPRSTKHICYCHSPTHFYWRHYDEYVKNPGFGIFSPLASFGLKLLVSPLRRLDYKAAQRPDCFIANSTHIKNDIKRYYGRNSVVIYPPVNVERFLRIPTSSWPSQAGTAQGESEQRKGDVRASTLTVSRSSQHSDVPASTSKVTGSASKQASAVRRSGFVTVGRLVPYKRVDIIIEACNELGAQLTVVGRGPEYKKLVRLAGPTIKFVTNATDEDVVSYMASAEAFIFAAHEDFGITPVEAMAAGTPVIAYKAGGALDYVIPGRTGEFFDEQTYKSLINILASFNHSNFEGSLLKRSSGNFSLKAFQIKIHSLIESIGA